MSRIGSGRTRRRRRPASRRRPGRPRASRGRRRRARRPGPRPGGRARPAAAGRRDRPRRAGGRCGRPRRRRPPAAARPGRAAGRGDRPARAGPSSRGPAAAAPSRARRRGYRARLSCVLVPEPPAAIDLVPAPDAPAGVSDATRRWALAFPDGARRFAGLTRDEAAAAAAAMAGWAPGRWDRALVEVVLPVIVSDGAGPYLLDATGRITLALSDHPALPGVRVAMGEAAPAAPRGPGAARGRAPGVGVGMGRRGGPRDARGGSRRARRRRRRGRRRWLGAPRMGIIWRGPWPTI